MSDHHSDSEDDVLIIPLHSEQRVCKTRDIFLNRLSPKSSSSAPGPERPLPTSNNNARIDFKQLRVEQKNQYPWNDERETFYKVKAEASNLLQQKLSEIRLKYKHELNNATLMYESRMAALEASGNAEASRAIEKCEQTIDASVRSLVHDFGTGNQQGGYLPPRKPEQDNSYDKALKGGVGKVLENEVEKDQEEEEFPTHLRMGRFRDVVNHNLDVDTSNDTNEDVAVGIDGGSTTTDCAERMKSPITPSPSRRRSNWRDNRAAIAADSALKASAVKKQSPARDLFSALTSRIESIETAVLANTPSQASMPVRMRGEYDKFVRLGNEDEESTTSTTSDEGSNIEII